MRRSKCDGIPQTSQDGGGRSPRRSPPAGWLVQSETSARSRCPTRRRAGQDGAAHEASVSAMASADRPQSDTQWRWKTRPSQPRWRGHWSDATSYTTIQPRLAVRDMSARQALILLMMKNQVLTPSQPDRQKRSPAWGKRAAGMG
jgi:hypothetical protein